MKLLNEKNLAYFATCDARVDKEGWLYKKGETNKNFQRRWFVLKGNLLYYFERKEDKDPSGVVILEGYTVELCENHNDQFAFMINFRGLGCRSYILSAESQEVMESWMMSITCAGYDYMKLVLADLQNRLDALNSHEMDNGGATKVASLEQSIDRVEITPVVPPESACASKRVERSNPFNTPSSDGRLIDLDASEHTSLDAFGHPPFETVVASAHTSPAPPPRKRDNAKKSLGIPRGKEERGDGRSPLLAHRHTRVAPGAPLGALGYSIPQMAMPRGALYLRRDFLQLQTIYGRKIEAFLSSSSPL